MSFIAQLVMWRLLHFNDVIVYVEGAALVRTLLSFVNTFSLTV